MKLVYLAKQIPYTGHELSPHWVASQLNEYASAIVAFRGPCHVDTSEMVDLEDRNQNFHIHAQEMLHFIGEWFDADLNLAIARQRLLIAGFSEVLRQHLDAKFSHSVRRNGNDLFVGDAKLSVSIVTASAVSTLFHFGVNINATGAPVNAIGLNDLKVNIDSLLQDVLGLWKRELDGMAKARCKVAAR